MRIVVQRVFYARVKVNDSVRGEIGPGLLVLVGIEDADTQEDMEWLCGKIVNMRLFPDEAGVMNLSVRDVAGEILLVSQFTLHASTKKGNRPGYSRAARPEKAEPMYEAMLLQLGKELGKPVAAGIFGADMKVELLNDGPVTIVMDSKNRE